MQTNKQLSSAVCAVRALCSRARNRSMIPSSTEWPSRLLARKLAMPSSALSFRVATRRRERRRRLCAPIVSSTSSLADVTCASCSLPNLLRSSAIDPRSGLSSRGGEEGRRWQSCPYSLSLLIALLKIRTKVCTTSPEDLPSSSKALNTTRLLAVLLLEIAYIMHIPTLFSSSPQQPMSFTARPANPHSTNFSCTSCKVSWEGAFLTRIRIADIHLQTRSTFLLLLTSQPRTASTYTMKHRDVTSSFTHVAVSVAWVHPVCP
mmetsp:Transcript_18750/g.43046  ORF Transcript_18750/g.43046 Transcript_18750/m.43046 type:complete len:262 (-) Transcript_18750:1054-1839(-)